MRIIYITHYTESYGANRSLLNLIDGLSFNGINDIVVLTPTQGLINDVLNKKNINNVVVPFKNEIHYTDQKHNSLKEFLKCFYNWFIVFRYASKIKGAGETIIHTNASVTFIGAYLSYWLKVPHVWHIREFGKEDYNIRYNYGYKYFQYWLNKANAVIAISKSIYNKRVRCSRASIKETVYNGVVFLNELKASSNKNQLQNKSMTFGMIGVVSKEKGQQDAIDAFILLREKYDNLKLTIAGEGDFAYVKDLKRKVAEYKLGEQITFLGFIGDTTSFYDSIDCLLMCSRNEALGRVTIEAMSNGVPVIGFDNAGTSEIIKDGYNGLLYKKNVEELSNTMAKLIEDDSLRRSIIDNSFETVKQQFTIEKYADSVAKIYQRVLQL